MRRQEFPTRFLKQLMRQPELPTRFLKGSTRLLKAATHRPKEAMRPGQVDQK
jgi:hypothetical protein